MANEEKGVIRTISKAHSQIAEEIIWNTTKENLIISSGQDIELYGKKEGILLGNYQEKANNETVNEVSFVAYPRILFDDPEWCNYGFDWNRDNDEKLHLRTKSKNDFVNNCISGKERYQNYYDTGKIMIKEQEYFAPGLMMFKNHGVITGKEVILSLYIISDNFKKLKNNLIKFQFNSSLLDIGFTEDGKNISANKFIFESRYFEKEYYKTRRNNRENKGVPISSSITNFEPLYDDYYNYFELSNLLVKCKEVIEKDEEVLILDINNSVVGKFIVKPNNKALFSNKKFCFLKVLRKKYKEADLATINNYILSTYISINGESKKYNSETEALNDISKAINTFGVSKFLVNFFNDFTTEILEVDDDNLQSAGIISENFVLKRSDYTDFLRKEIKGKDENIYFFFSAIRENNNVAASFGHHSNSGLFYSSTITTYFHELGHSLGLSHTFTDDDNSEDFINRLKNNLKKYREDVNTSVTQKKANIDKYEAGKDKYTYPFVFQGKKIENKKKWQEEIDSMKNKLAVETDEYNKEIKSQETKINFNTRVVELNNIKFKKGTIDNIMEYPDTSIAGTVFYFQHEIITKLNEEFPYF